MSGEGDLDALLAAAAAKLSPVSLEELLRAQREAEQGPPPLPSTIPQADFPTFGVVRYHCPLRCGWWHDERPGMEPPSALILPADFTERDLSDMMSLNAEARSLAYHARVEQAIADHYKRRHPAA